MTHAWDVLPLVDALESFGAPEPMRAFNDAFVRTAPRPTFTEHSAVYGEDLVRHRLTHYFPAHDAEANEQLVVRLEALAQTFYGKAGAEAVRAVRARISHRTDLEQLIVGIDAAAAAGESRLKLYALRREPFGHAELEALLGDSVDALDPAQWGVDAARVFLVGHDFGKTGLTDVKLYEQLDRRALAACLDGTPVVARLLRAARGVVRSTSTMRPRVQLHFHATDDRFYLPILASIEAARPVLAYAREVERALAGHGRLGAWIIGLPLAGRSVDVTRGNVYFHVTHDALNARNPRRTRST